MGSPLYPAHRGRRGHPSNRSSARKRQKARTSATERQKAETQRVRGVQLKQQVLESMHSKRKGPGAKTGSTCLGPEAGWWVKVGRHRVVVGSPSTPVPSSLHSTEVWPAGGGSCPLALPMS